ncbi:MAG: geranylgeranyl diphosphate synthase, type [Alphaproteobacteria bacterium]|nr:geranylgeranyl diphosphate synthase, type [Alphaproteobacteria bacterium]
MDATTRIERALLLAMERARADSAPPRLASAMHYALFPGGARIRPRLCLAVACACGEDDPAITDAAAAAIELLHCASLVHDDLPCFDDAATRRGKPTVHRAFDEPLAVLAGDGLIVLAFETLARGAAAAPQRLSALMLTLGRAVGMPAGMVAGQAWESEPDADLAAYHRAKTGALFAAATMAGAVASGADADAWRAVGELIGEAYQVTDDLHDAVGDVTELGKATGVDCALGRPSAVQQLGVSGALQRLTQLLAAAVGSVPDCVGAAELRDQIQEQAARFVPTSITARLGVKPK